MRKTLLAAALLSLGAFADDLTPDQIAKLQSDQKKAAEAVEKKYGDGKLSASERKELAKEKAAAEAAVLEKAGVDKKEFVRASTKQSRDDRAATEAAMKDIEAKDKAAADKKGGAAEKKGGGKEIVIEKNGKVQGAEVNEAAEMDKAAGYGKK